MYNILNNAVVFSPSFYELQPSMHETDTSQKLYKRRIDWVAQLLMVGSLAVGVALAVGHHLFYQSLNLRPVKGTTQQEWYGRVGTGLAFLVKTSLGIAIGTAFVQQLWLSLKNQNISVRSLDTAFSILNNPLGFIDLKIWSANLILLLLTLIPLIAVVMPATLTTSIQSSSSSASIIVPELNFDKSIFTVKEIATSQGAYAASKVPVIKSVTTSTLQGSILPIQPPAPNCSYSTNFFGPALSCDLYDKLKNHDEYPTVLKDPFLQYLAWTGSFTEFNGSRALFPIGNADEQEQNLGPATLWINVNTTILQCALFDASYSANFSFASGEQYIRVKRNKLLNSIGAHFDLEEVKIPGEELAYDAIMASFGKIFVGSIEEDQYRQVDVSNTLIQATKLGLDNAVNGSQVEELFQNTTMSLLSDNIFWKNKSSTTPIQVDTQDFRPVYTYNPENVYITYGCGIFITCLSVLIGCLSISRNNAAYSNNFSTVLRVTRDKTFDLLVSKEHRSGEDPLPEYIAKARVEFDSTLGATKRRTQGFEVLYDSSREP